MKCALRLALTVALLLLRVLTELHAHARSTCIRQVESSLDYFGCDLPSFSTYAYDVALGVVPSRSPVQPTLEPIRHQPPRTTRSSWHQRFTGQLRDEETDHPLGPSGTRLRLSPHGTARIDIPKSTTRPKHETVTSMIPTSPLNHNGKTMDAKNVADFLSRALLQSVTAIPMGDVQGLYLGVLLSSREHLAYMTGEAFDLPDRTEAYFLTASDFDPGQPWIGSEGRPAWETEDLLAIWNGSRLAEMWLGPRSVRYFLDPEDHDRGLTPQGLLDSAAAIEFRTATAGPSQRIVLFATFENPCSIEVATTPERCDFSHP